MGVFAPLVGIVGATQAAEALKLIAGVGDVARRPPAAARRAHDALARSARAARSRMRVRYAPRRGPHDDVDARARRIARGAAGADAHGGARASATRASDRRTLRTGDARTVAAPPNGRRSSASSATSSRRSQTDDGARAFTLRVARHPRRSSATPPTFLRWCTQRLRRAARPRATREFLEGAVIDGHVIQPLRLVLQRRYGAGRALHDAEGRRRPAGGSPAACIAPSTVQSDRSKSAVSAAPRASQRAAHDGDFAELRPARLPTLRSPTTPRARVGRLRATRVPSTKSRLQSAAQRAARSSSDRARRAPAPLGRAAASARIASRRYVAPARAQRERRAARRSAPAPRLRARVAQRGPRRRDCPRRTPTRSRQRRTARSCIAPRSSTAASAFAAGIDADIGSAVTIVPDQRCESLRPVVVETRRARRLLEVARDGDRRLSAPHARLAAQEHRRMPLSASRRRPIGEPVDGVAFGASVGCTGCRHAIAERGEVEPFAGRGDARRGVMPDLATRHRLASISRRHPVDRADRRRQRAQPQVGVSAFESTASATSHRPRERRHRRRLRRAGSRAAALQSASARRRIGAQAGDGGSTALRRNGERRRCRDNDASHDKAHGSHCIRSADGHATLSRTGTCAAASQPSCGVRLKPLLAKSCQRPTT